jgi:hypothetical protein
MSDTPQDANLADSEALNAHIKTLVDAVDFLLSQYPIRTQAGALKIMELRNGLKALMNSAK